MNASNLSGRFHFLTRVGQQETHTLFFKINLPNIFSSCYTKNDFVWPYLQNTCFMFRYRASMNENFKIYFDLVFKMKLNSLLLDYRKRNIL